MESIKDKYFKRCMNTSTIRLTNLNKEALFRKIQEIEEFDKIHYRKTCIFQPKVRRKPRIFDEDESVRQSSSEESIDYYEFEPYKPGTLGLISVKDKKQKSHKVISTSKLRPKETVFDLISTIILNELGIVNKFMKKGKYFIKVDPKIREKRKFYV